MKPSDWSTSSTRPRRVEAGVETEFLRRICALRMRVSISPIGSEKLMSNVSLPARLDQARDLTQVAQLAQRDTAQLQLAVVATGTTRDFTAITDAHWRRIAWQFCELELCAKADVHGDRLVLGERLERST